MTEFVNVKVRTIVKGEAFWETEAAVNEGAALNINMDRVIAQLIAEREILAAFVRQCTKKGGATVNGTSLAAAANGVLQKCPGVVDPELNKDAT